MNTHESKWILDVTDDTFQQEVIERSRQTLCVVDFWAEWCGPCRMLGPILEELARQYEGRFILCKVNTEAAQRTSMEYGIQSIPAVFAFSQGQPVDGFAGVQPQEQIERWIDRQLAQLDLHQAIELVATDPAQAITRLQELQAAQPDESAIQIGLAEAYLAADQPEQSSAIIAELEERGFLEPEAEKVKAKLDLQSKAGLDLKETAAQARSNPNDLELQLQYASALLGHQRYEEGFEICLGVVQRDKTGAGERARDLMVEVFRSLPDDSELTHEYRRKLSMALY